METESVSNPSSARILLGVGPGEVPALTARLRRWGYHVCAAVPSVQEAVERVAELYPELFAAFDHDPDEDPHKWLERLEVLESDEATPSPRPTFRYAARWTGNP